MKPRTTEGELMLRAGKGDQVAAIQLQALWAARAKEYRDYVRKEHGGNYGRAIMSAVRA